jgi:hypothetical protein
MLRSATDRQSNKAGTEACLDRADQLVGVAPPVAQDRRDVGLSGNRGEILKLEEGHAP